MSIELKLNDVIHYIGNDTYTGKVVKVKNKTVVVYWDDGTSTNENIITNENYIYVGNTTDSDFERKVFSFQLKGFVISNVSHLKDLEESQL